eukprot:gene31871-715_t
MVTTDAELLQRLPTDPQQQDPQQDRPQPQDPDGE